MRGIIVLAEGMQRKSSRTNVSPPSPSLPPFRQTPAAVLPFSNGVVEGAAGEVGAKGVDGWLAAAETAGPALPYLPGAVLPSPVQQVRQDPARLHFHPAGAVVGAAGGCGGRLQGRSLSSFFTFFFSHFLYQFRSHVSPSLPCVCF